jgi:hypothetical protein
LFLKPFRLFRKDSSKDGDKDGASQTADMPVDCCIVVHEGFSGSLASIRIVNSTKFFRVIYWRLCYSGRDDLHMASTRTRKWSELSAENEVKRQTTTPQGCQGQRVKYQILMRPVEVELHADEQTHVTKLLVAFRNLANGPENEVYFSFSRQFFLVCPMIFVSIRLKVHKVFICELAYAPVFRTHK